MQLEVDTIAAALAGKLGCVHALMQMVYRPGRVTHVGHLHS